MSSLVLLGRQGASSVSVWPFGPLFLSEPSCLFNIQAKIPGLHVEIRKPRKTTELLLKLLVVTMTCWCLGNHCDSRPDSVACALSVSSDVGLAKRAGSWLGWNEACQDVHHFPDLSFLALLAGPAQEHGKLSCFFRRLPTQTYCRHRHIDNNDTLPFQIVCFYFIARKAEGLLFLICFPRVTVWVRSLSISITVWVRENPFSILPSPSCFHFTKVGPMQHSSWKGAEESRHDNMTDQTPVNESHHTSARARHQLSYAHDKDAVARTYESCHTNERVMPHVWMRHEYVMSHEWMRDVACMNVPRRTYEHSYVRSVMRSIVIRKWSIWHLKHTHESRTSHGTRTNNCTGHKRTSHVTYTNVSRHTHECVPSLIRMCRAILMSDHRM